jgi:hypothetical protein
MHSTCLAHLSLLNLITMHNREINYCVRTIGQEEP